MTSGLIKSSWLNLSEYGNRFSACVKKKHPKQNLILLSSKCIATNGNQFNWKENLDLLRDAYWYFSFSMTLWIKLHFENKAWRGNPFSLFSCRSSRQPGSWYAVLNCPAYTASVTSLSPQEWTSKQKRSPTLIKQVTKCD